MSPIERLNRRGPVWLPCGKQECTYIEFDIQFNSLADCWRLDKKEVIHLWTGERIPILNNLVLRQCKIFADVGVDDVKLVGVGICKIG